MLEVAERRKTPVLITAEAGCRPGAIAEWLHARARTAGPLLSIDCATTEASEIDRRLFGTPPRRTVQQDLEAIGGDAALLEAAGGTLFLQHVDELPASAQRRLARVLRDGEVRVAARVQPVAVRCRLVASTARDLDTEVRDGRFREDLRRRLMTTRIAVPSIRQRAGDLAAIVAGLVGEMSGASRTFTQPAVTVLAALPWPQNVDELAGVLAKVLAGGGAIVRQEDVLPHLPIDGAYARLDLTTSLRDARRRFERDYIGAVLERHQWRMSAAAAALGIERANLYRKTRQLGIVRASRAEVS